jgi:hypothetical protein
VGKDNRERRKQKKAVRERKRRDAPPPGSLAARVTAASRWPISGAWILSNWLSGGSAGAVLLRQHPTDGRNAAAVFYVDLWCMGVKVANVRFDVVPEDLIERLGQDGFPLVPCEPELVAGVVAAGSAYGRDLGIAQHPDLPVVREMLGGIEPVPVQCGRDGKPLYIAGPNDDPGAVLGQLRRQLGANITRLD